jgi:hypothetical protein
VKKKGTVNKVYLDTQDREPDPVLLRCYSTGSYSTRCGENIFSRCYIDATVPMQ